MKNLQLKKIKFRMVSVVCITLITTVFSCSEAPQSSENKITKNDIERLKKNHIITLNTAVKQYDKYTKQRCDILKDTLEKKYKDPQFNDTRNVWLDIKTIKAYIQYIEDNASDAEGLSFYFGVNSDKASDKTKNHQTFFIAPTVMNVIDGDTIQSGFTVKKGKRVFLYEAIKEYEKGQKQNIQKASFFSFAQDNDDDDDDGFLFNRVEDSPPNDNN